MEPGTETGWAGSWTLLTVLITILTGAGIAAGVWLLESRRAVRRAGDELASAIRGRTADLTTRDAPVTVACSAPLWGGPVHVEVSGRVDSPHQRESAMTIVDEECARARFPTRVTDSVTVDSARRSA